MCQNVKRRLVVRSNGDRRHSTMIFSGNVVVVETSYQILKVLPLCVDREKAQPLPIKITVLTFLVKKYNEAFRMFTF